MPIDEIVNPMIDPAIRRRQLIGLIVPIASVLLVTSVIAMVSYYSYSTIRQSAITLSHDLLHSQQRYITQEVSNYIAPAVTSGIIAHDMLDRENPIQNVDTFMLLGRSVLHNSSQVDSLYLANQQGDFLRVERAGNDYLQSAIVSIQGKRYYLDDLVDAEGRQIGQKTIPAGDFNPAKEPWFIGAVRHENYPGANRIFWTDPYQPHGSTQFVVTAAIAGRTLNGRQIVFAINISLNQLSDFINHLHVATTGQAVIVDLNGRVIAGHNMVDLGKPGFNAADVHLNPETQPVFVRALNLFRVLGDGAGIVRARGQNYVTMAADLPLAKRSWVLLLNAPESDFASFARVIGRQTVYLSLIVVSLAVFLACGLLFQGRRISRLHKTLAADQFNNEIDNSLVLRIANTPGLLDPEHEVPILTEVLAQRAGARRAGIWRLLPDGERLLCEDVFDTDGDVHGTGLEITRSVCPQLFENLSTFQVVDVGDAADSPSYQALWRLVMRPAGTRSLIYLPVIEMHQPLGVIMIENAQDPDAADRTMVLIASIVAIRFSQLKNSQPAHVAPLQEVLANNPPQGRMRNLPAFLLTPAGQKATAEGGVPDGLYPAVPILVLEFEEAFTLDEQAVKTRLKLVEELAAQIQEVADKTGLFSIQVSGKKVILVGGCTPQPDEAALLRLAEAAVAIRETCITMLAATTSPLMFRMGIDIGPVLAASLGDPPVFNVWGEALTNATLMCTTAPDGGQIQVSQQAYWGLRAYFLFRPRGDFYLPGDGVTCSYILAGKL
ncbi:GAF domain-containing protein [Formicincola oecophyllae]|uniref:GAF domain-containing protein n=1 Tax=Formicincola oecophyllae TaxID=2558361 RepID=A0A4Y6U6C5_9PROT|nr:adenylate/guanylate cyclase domain-containing protein [Formicincola oecophyllae]QDH12892.1 GAF domain-containing protein [Formicincola oecophyllae]